MGSRAHGLSSCNLLGLCCSEACEILVSQPEIKLISPALEGGFLTTGPPGKSFKYILEWGKTNNYNSWRDKTFLPTISLYFSCNLFSHGRGFTNFRLWKNKGKSQDYSSESMVWGVGGGWGRDWFLATEWVQLKYDDIGPKTSNQIPEEPPNMLALSFSHLCILICYFFWQQLEV